MQRVSFPDFTAFSADAFWKSGGIFLSCQIIGTGWTRLASLPACLLPTFTQHSRWHQDIPWEFYNMVSELIKPLPLAIKETTIKDIKIVTMPSRKLCNDV